MSDKAYAAFESDVPEQLRDDAMQMMSEATGGCGTHACVTIIDRDQMDAVNYRANGIIEIEGREYTFQMEDGNRNGTVLLAWNDDAPLEKEEPVRWALQPAADLVEKAINGGKGRLLLAKWHAMLAQAEMAELIRAYGYDRHFAPGIVTERHWRDKAAKRGLVIVSEETAAETRCQLAA